MVPEQPGAGEAPLAQATSNTPDPASPEVALRSVMLSSDSWEKSLLLLCELMGREREERGNETNP